MKTRIGLLLALAGIAASASAQTNPGLALTPPMGWNSWNLFEGNINETNVQGIADAMCETGMKAAGYEYIILDDYWAGGRDTQNHIFADPQKFPNGMKSLADYVHSNGLKLGIYSDAAAQTCGGSVGSLNFEEADARTFAGWGIDYLKYDYCGAPEDVATAFARYRKMADALKKTGRPMVFAICEWGVRKPWLWAKAAGGHLWRTTWDSRDSWQSHDSGKNGVMEILDKQEKLGAYNSPGGWNDPDLLMVGLYGKGGSSNILPKGVKPGCTDTEYRSHFALWCMMSSPLILNCDVRKLNEATKEIVLNGELIKLDQDPLGKQCETLVKKDGIQAFRKELAGGDVAICVLNRNEAPQRFSFKLKEDLDLWAPYSGKEIFGNKPVTGEAVSEVLPAHACRVYRFNRDRK
jgi:alpha-galactosidase